MYREIIYFCAELLNYWSMTFFGLKLFAKLYEFSVHRNKNVENVIYAVLCLPISLIAAGNFRYALYSNFLNYCIVFYLFIIILILNGKPTSIVLIASYVFYIRLIDLWVASVVVEVSKFSRDVHINVVQTGSSRMIFVVVLAMSYYFIFNFLSKKHFIYYLKENRYYCGMACLYGFLGISCFNGIYRFDYKEELINYWSFYLICAFIFIGSVMVYFIGIKGKERERLLNLRNDMMKENYLGLQKVYEEHRTLQHDHKNHMLAVNELVKENKNKEALDYIQNYLIIGNKKVNEIQSGNDIINIILGSKIAEAEAKGIMFIYEVDYLEQLSMDNIDICALVANLLDNAVEACEKIIEQESKILLKMLKKNDMFVIQIMNSIKVDSLKKKHLFKTDKDNPELHGWGMYSVEQVVKKYGGEKRFFIRDGMIEIFITIPL